MNPTPAKAKQAPTRILLIEDEPAVTAFLRTALERAGYSVDPVRSGAEGIERLKSGQFGGVISDIRMPGEVNGAEVQSWIQRHRPDMCSRLILISGDTANNETQELLASGGAPFIEKPFRLKQLLSIVEQTFGKP